MAQLAPSITSSVQVITDPEDAREIYSSAAMVGVDVETTGLRPFCDRVAVVSLASPARPPAVLRCPGGNVPAWIFDLLQRPGITVVGHNLAAFDLPFLMAAGLRLSPDVRYVDTLILEQLCLVSGRRDLRRDLKSTLHRRLGVDIKKDADHSMWESVELTEQQLIYCAQDVSYLTDLMDAQFARISELDISDAAALECRVVPVTASIVATGLPFRRATAAAAKAMYDCQISEMLEMLRGFGIQNPRSSVNIQAYLRSVGINVKKTDVEVLEHLIAVRPDQAEVISTILGARRLLKREMYDGEWFDRYQDPDGRVRARYWQLGTDTGRFSSSDPNLQQVPRDMRWLVGYDDPGRSIVSIDYSQIEVLISAAIFNDPALLRDVASSDFHRSVASRMFNVSPENVTPEQRSVAKAASFTILFAGGAAGVVRAANNYKVKLSQTDAADVVQTYYELYPTMSRVIATIRKRITACQIGDRPYVVRVPGGPKRVLIGDSLTPSTAINTVVQGTAAVGLKRAIRRIWERYPNAIAAVVHDEVVLDVDDGLVDEVTNFASTVMADEMENLIHLRPNVHSTIGHTWGNQQLEVSQ